MIDGAAFDDQHKLTKHEKLKKNIRKLSKKIGKTLLFLLHTVANYNLILGMESKIIKPLTQYADWDLKKL